MAVAPASRRPERQRTHRWQRPRAPATPKSVLDEIGAQAVSKVLTTIEQRDFEKDREAALETFKTDFEEISGDENLRNMADGHSARLFKEHPDWSPGKNILEAAKQTQEWVDEFRGGVETPTGEAEKTNAKLEEKRSLSPVRSASGRNKPVSKPKTECNSEYVARQSKNRGLE